MKFVLRESKSSPLYHYTRLQSFQKIIDSNELRAFYNIRTQKIGTEKTPFVSLTRDINRSFIPSGESLLAPSIGFRLDGEKLAMTYGRKIKPTVNPGMGRYEAEERIEGSIKNLDQYITGLIFANNDSDTLKRLPSWLDKDPVAVLSYLLYQNRFGKQLVDAARKFNVPIIFKRREYTADIVESAYNKMRANFEF